LLIAALLPASVRAAEAPSVSAEAAVVAELETGRILYAKNADRPMKAASTVKILTGLLALENLDPGRELTVLPEWTGLEGSSMYLRAGETVTVSDLLYGLLLVSGNDAAQALACTVAGSEEAFVALMNRRAAELGMEGSVFADASGLQAEGHRVTARDMAVLACAAMKNPDFRAIVSMRTAEAAGQTLRNHNKLLERYEGAVGVKTGYTRAAGRTLVSCAERQGLTLVCVTLNAPQDWEDHAALLDWGFGRFVSADPSGMEWSLGVVSGTEPEVPVRPAPCGRVLLPKEGVRWEAELPRFVYAPVKAGEEAGTLACRDGEGNILCRLPLLYARDVGADPAQKLGFWEKLRWAWRFACRHSAGYPQYVFY
jgi:D-alanyl-D-alanine carboxypeptidase (penicillin-binding protein 5/6)